MKCQDVADSLTTEPITPEIRAAIFAKEVLTIEDLQRLLLLPYQSAAKLMRDIKRKCDRYPVQGKLHIQDYLDYFKLDGSGRYAFASKQESKADEERSDSEHIYRSVCYSSMR